MDANNTVSLGPRGNKKARPLRGAAKQANARARDLELRVWKLLEKGKTPTEIAHEVGIARPSAHRIIRRVEDWYCAQIFETVDRVKRKQARMLQIVVNEAMAGWARSVNEGTRAVSAKRSSDQCGSETSQTRTLTAGDPEFLRVAIEALRDIRELYGIGGAASASLMEFDGGGTLKIRTVWGTPAESGDATPGPTARVPSDSTSSPEPYASAACKGHP
jgi:hypothetical protein